LEASISQQPICEFKHKAAIQSSQTTCKYAPLGCICAVICVVHRLAQLCQLRLILGSQSLHLRCSASLQLRKLLAGSLALLFGSRGACLGICL
jgi:hypothetical protein